MIRTDLKPVKVYKKKIKNPETDKPLEIIINVYDEPVVTSPSMSFYTRVIIMEGKQQWGTRLIPFPVEEDDSERQLDFIETNINIFKDK